MWLASHCIRVKRIHCKQVRTSNPPFPSGATNRCSSGRARSSIGRVAVACTTQAHAQPEQALHLFLIHLAPMVVKCGGRWSVTFACHCTGTISREEGWEEWVLLLPPGSRTCGASFWSCLPVNFWERFGHPSHGILARNWVLMYNGVSCAIACSSG